MSRNSEYRDLLTWAFLGEVWGQRMLERLLESNVFPAETEHLQVLLALETRTRLRLKSLADQDLQTVDAEGETLREAEEYAAGLERSADWGEWMRETMELTAGFLPKYERLLELGSPEALPVLQETLEHERAVHHYAEQRLLGRRDQAVRGVADHLQRWHEPVGEHLGNPSRRLSEEKSP